MQIMITCFRVKTDADEQMQHNNTSNKRINK